MPIDTVSAQQQQHNQIVESLCFALQHADINYSQPLVWNIEPLYLNIANPLIVVFTLGGNLGFGFGAMTDSDNDNASASSKYGIVSLTVFTNSLSDTKKEPMLFGFFLQLDSEMQVCRKVALFILKWTIVA